MKFLLWYFFFVLFFYPLRGWSCPFCDLGGKDTAYFILFIFGFFALGAAIFLFAFFKSGGLKKEKEEEMKNKVLKAENISGDDSSGRK